MIPILKEGRIDLINSFMVYTPERAQQVLMIPYGATAGSVIVGKKNTDKIDGLEYFSGKFLATELGTIDYRDAKAVSDELVKAGKPPIDIHTFGTYADVLQAVVAGQADGGMLGIEQSVYFRNKGANFRLAISNLDPHPEALAFSNRELADAVAKVMNEMKADGSFDKIFAPYGHCVLPGPYKVTTGPEPSFTCPPRKD
jgi:polar amino acid transport system substrate-binding protein